MLKTLIVVALVGLAGCAAFQPLAKKAGKGAPEPDSEPIEFQADQIAEVPLGRFCRVRSTLPNTVYEGTLLSSTQSEIVLVDAVVVAPRTIGLFGSLPFDWSRHMTRGTDLTFPERVAVSRESIAGIEVYDVDESERLRAEYAKWRKQQQSLRDELLTTQEFPSSG